jgi:MFS family permease
MKKKKKVLAQTGLQKAEDTKSSSKHDKPSIKKIVIVTGVFIFTFIVLRFTAESLLISLTFVADENYQYTDNQIQYTSIFQTTAYMMVYFGAFIMTALTKQIEERKIMVWIIIVVIAGVIIGNNLIYDSLYSFTTGFLISACVVHLLEGITTALLTKLMPPEYQEGFFNTGFVVTIATSFGKMAGSSYATVAVKLARSLGISITIVVTSTVFVVQALNLLIILFTYHLFKTAKESS